MQPSRSQVEAAGQLVAARKAALLQQVHATGRGEGVGAYHRNQRRNGRDEAQKEKEGERETAK